MKKRRWALILAALFTVITGAITLFNVAAIAAAFYYRPTIEAAGSGGIGAVSSGLPEALLEALPLIVLAIAVNLSVAAPARQRDSGAVWIRRAHLAWTVLTPFAFVLLVPMMLASGGLEDISTIIFAVNVAVFGAHAAFGVFASRLLRGQA